MLSLENCVLIFTQFLVEVIFFVLYLLIFTSFVFYLVTRVGQYTGLFFV